METVEHKMKLQNKPFESIKKGLKTIEMRLYDEKRQIINIKDTIEFTNLTTEEKMKVVVKDFHLFRNFEELYKSFKKSELGYEENEIANPKDMSVYYSNEDIEKYGVCGIEIELI